MGKPGEVYIFHNCGFRIGLIKIGLTTRTAEARARELRTTGVSDDFLVIFSQWVNDASAVEKKLHERFRDFRYKHDREFFHVSPKQAIHALLEEAGVLESEEAGSHDGADVISTLRARYGALLDESLRAVVVEGGGDEPVTLRCEVGKRGDQRVEKRDLEFIVDQNGPYFASARDNMDATTLFLRLDPYTLIMTADLFSERGAQLIADMWEQLRLDDDAMLNAINSANATLRDLTIDSIEAAIRQNLDLPNTKIHAVSLLERDGKFLLSSNREFAPVRLIHVEFQGGGEFSRSKHLILTGSAGQDARRAEDVELG